MLGRLWTYLLPTTTYSLKYVQAKSANSLACHGKRMVYRIPLLSHLCNASAV